MIQRAGLLAAICAAMTAIHLVDLLLGGLLNNFGIHPRDPASVWTIVTSPWLHSDWGHLGSNLATFVVLGALNLLNGIRYFVKASAVIIVIGGALEWLLARDGNHIGASGWIFGLWTLVIAQAWYDRRWPNIAIAIGVLVFYGSMALGVLPLQGGVSFESHFFGAIAGLFAAKALSRPQAIEARPAERASELKFWPDGKA